MKIDVFYFMRCGFLQNLEQKLSLEVVWKNTASMETATASMETVTASMETVTKNDEVSALCRLKIPLSIKEIMMTILIRSVGIKV